MSQEEKKPIGVILDYSSAGGKYLAGINYWITSTKPGYKSIYKSFDQYRQANKLVELTAYEKLKRAYEYFVKDKKPTRGNPPELSTYARKRVTTTSTPLRSRSPVQEPPVYQPPGFEQQPAPTYQPPNVNNDFSINKMSSENDDNM